MTKTFVCLTLIQISLNTLRGNAQTESGAKAFRKIDESAKLIMISTKHTALLPDKKSLQATCKAISVLDAIISPEWEFRYYSYNSNWDVNEECLQMRNGQGDEMHILFMDNGCAINGFAHEFPQQDKTMLTKGLPAVFSDFIFGEPVASIGTTFCLWTTDSAWKVGEIGNIDDYSGKMLGIFDGNPETYIGWATEYFDGSYKETGIPLETVSRIYKGETLTKEMVLSIGHDIDDWNQLIADIDEIGYPHNLIAEQKNTEKKPKWKFW